MRRSRVGLGDVADWGNLMDAFGKAARGKRGRGDVEAYRAGLDREIERLRDGLLAGDLPVGRMRRFSIRDPKPRIIHAPSFRERVLHHALMNRMGPVLDRALVFDSYACRVGKGALRAVHRVQHHLARSPWYAQIDIRHCFPSIGHDRLLAMLARKFSDHGLSALVERIIRAHEDGPGRGLPIGALTSQNFANFYLAGVDRLVLRHPDSRGHVRYMDDLVWWGGDRSAVRRVLGEVVAFLGDALGLEVKTPWRVGRSRAGLVFCGYRIEPDRLLLSRRRKRRYAAGRKSTEEAFERGRIDAAALQRRMDAILAITAHADALTWRRAELARRPLVAAAAGA